MDVVPQRKTGGTKTAVLPSLWSQWVGTRIKEIFSKAQTGDGSLRKMNVCKQLENLIHCLLYLHPHSNLRAVKRIRNLKSRLVTLNHRRSLSQQTLNLWLALSLVLFGSRGYRHEKRIVHALRKFTSLCQRGKKGSIMLIPDRNYPGWQKHRVLQEQKGRLLGDGWDFAMRVKVEFAEGFLRSI